MKRIRFIALSSSSARWQLVCLILMLGLLMQISAARDLPDSVANPATSHQLQWKTLTTKDQEFSILLPGEPTGIIKGHYNLGIDGVPIREERVVSSLYARTAYLVKMYETGSAKELFRTYGDIFRLAKENVSDVNVNGLEGKQYREKTKAIFHRILWIATKSRVYVIEVASRDETDPNIERFFSSLTFPKLGAGLNTGNTIANLDALNNPDVVAPEIDHGPPLSESEVTHPAVIIYNPPPSFGHQGKNTTIKLQLLFSSSGKITDVKVVERTPGAANDQAVAAAKFIIFLPAEKDGRLVSQYGVVSYNFRQP